MTMQNAAKPKSRPKRVDPVKRVSRENIDAARDAALESSRRAWKERKVANRKKSAAA